MKKKVYLLAACLGVLSLATLMSACGKEEKQPEQVQETTVTEESAQITEAADKNETEAEIEAEQDNTDPQELYEAFLNGTEKVYTDNCGYTRYDETTGEECDFYGPNDGYNIYEFISRVMEAEDDMFKGSPLSSIKYAYIDSGDDNNKELAIDTRFAVGDYDERVRQFVVKVVDKKLVLTYQNESYYKSFVDISNEYGKVIGFISSGAVSNSYVEGYINAEGKYDLCYNEWKSYDATLLLDGRFDDAMGKTGDNYDEAFLRAYYFGDNDDNNYLYCAELGDEPSNGLDREENVSRMQKLFDEAGVKLYSEAEINELIGKREEELKVTAKVKQGEPVEWKEIDGFDYDAVNSLVKSEEVATVKDVIEINPFSESNFMWEGALNCYITDRETGVVYHFGEETVISEGVSCYDDGCDQMTWLSRYLNHSALFDEDMDSPYYCAGFATGDIWTIEVDANNNILNVKSITYWD